MDCPLRFVILFNFCNLALIKKDTARQASEILILQRYKLGVV